MQFFPVTWWYILILLWQRIFPQLLGLCHSGNNSEAVPIRLSLPGILILSRITQHLKMVVCDDGSGRDFFLVPELVPHASRDLVLKPFF